MALLLAAAWLAASRPARALTPLRGLGWPLGLFFAWILVSVVLTRPEAKDVKDALGKWSFALLVLPACAYARNAGPGRIRKMMMVLLAATVVLFPYMIWSVWETDYGRARAFSGGAPNLGTNLMMASIVFAAATFSARKGRGLPGAAAVLILLAGLGLTFNRSAMLGVAAGLGLMTGRRSPILLAALLAVFAAFLVSFPGSAPVKRMRTILVYSESASSRERTRMWASGLMMIRDQPLLGFASRRNFIECYGERYRDPASEEKIIPGHVHNSVLQTAILHGIPGLGLALWWLLVLLRKARVLYLRAGSIRDPEISPLALALAPMVIAVLINAQFDFVIADGQRAMMFYTLTGLMLGAASAKPNLRPDPRRAAPGRRRARIPPRA
jgi:O-antigen ligase